MDCLNSPPKTTLICDTCERKVIETTSFEGSLELKFKGKFMSFMGQEMAKPSFSIRLKVCQKCALQIMNKHKGILINE